MSSVAIDVKKNLAFVDARLELGAPIGKTQKAETDGKVDDVYQYENGNIWVRHGSIRLVEAQDCTQGTVVRIPGKVVGVAANSSAGRYLGSDAGLGHVYYSFIKGTVWAYNDPSIKDPPTFQLSDNSAYCGDPTTSSK